MQVEPIEQLATIRVIPNCCVIRPSDANETSYAWLTALENKTKPTILLLTRQTIPTFDRTECAPASETRKGGYTLWENKKGSTPEIILIGTGSETHLALEAGKKLASEGRTVRVVSLPSFDLFEAQPKAYRDSVLPPSVTKRVAVEAGVSFGWDRYIGAGGKFVGIDHFGASAPGNVLAKEFGFTVDNVYNVAKSL